MEKKYFKLYVVAFLLFGVFRVSYAQDVNSPRGKNSTRQKQPSNTTQADKVMAKGLVLDNYGRPLGGVHISAENGEPLSLSDSTGHFVITAEMASSQFTGSIVFFHKGYDKAFVNPAKINGNGNSRGYDHGHDLNQPLTVRLNASQLAGRPAIDHNITDQNTSQNTDQGKLQVVYGNADLRSFLGSYATTTNKEIINTPAPQYSYALAGRLAGLNVIQTEGFYMPSLTAQTAEDIFIGNIPTNSSGTGPTDNNQFKMQLRGHSGSMGQSPVVIIDGVQRDFYSLDPENIESVTILKDALSTIKLGQNSSRGALIVTTLQPVTGKPHLSFSAQTGMQEALKLPEPLGADKYAYLLNEALLNEGQRPAYSGEDFALYRDGTDPLGHPNVNWYNAILKDHSSINRYSLHVTGGSKTAQYLVALNYLDQNGLFKTANDNHYNTNLSQKRYSIDSKIRFNVTKDFDLGLNIIGRLSNNNQPGSGTQNILSQLLMTPNNAYPLYNPDGSFAGNANYTNNLLSQVINSGYLSEQERDILVNVDMHYRLDNWVKGWWIKAKGTLSVQSASYLNRSKQSPVFQWMTTANGDNMDTTYARYGNTINQNNGYTTTSWARYWYAQASTGIDRQIGAHNFGASLLYDQKQTLFNYDLPAVLTNYGFSGKYDYSKKYFAQLGLDYGGYSRYQSGHQFGLFYAGGLGWDLAQESFLLHSAKWINQLKLRGTYGKTGNANVDNYGYYIWNAHFNDVLPSYQLGSAYPAPAGKQEGATLANVNATWEKANKLDLGLDLTLFNHHLQASFDYYYEKYYDVMQERGKSIALIGAEYPAENVGIDIYRGAEMSLTYQNNLKDFNYYITANAAVQSTRIEYMDEQYQAFIWNKHTGLPVDQRFGLIADGFIQTADEAAAAPTITGYTIQVGDVKYKDLNSDGIIDQFDVAPLGSTKPLIYYGLSAGFSYKGIELNFLIQGVQNRDIYVNNGPVDAGFAAQNNGFGQAYVPIQNRWTPETAGSAIYPRLTAGGNGYNYGPLFQSSSLFLHNGNYLRLKNVSVAYSLPYAWTQSLKVGRVKLFVNALNLFTWAAYDRVDPEISLEHYPMQRVINTGINIKF